jgi:hypothetical protein
MAPNINPNPPQPPFPGVDLSGTLGSLLGKQFSGGGGGIMPGLNYRSGQIIGGGTRGTVYDPYFTSPDFYGQQAGFRQAQIQRDYQARQQQLQRQFQAEQEGLRWQRFSGLVNPLMERYQGFLGSGGPQSSYDPNDPALLALESSIEQGGGEEQAELQSILAGSGNIRAGALGEASALRLGRTRALVAGKRGEFAQAASDRDLRRWEAKMNNYSSMLRELMGSYF